MIKNSDPLDDIVTIINGLEIISSANIMSWQQIHNTIIVSNIHDLIVETGKFNVFINTLIPFTGLNYKDCVRDYIQLFSIIKKEINEYQNRLKVFILNKSFHNKNIIFRKNETEARAYFKEYICDYTIDCKIDCYEIDEQFSYACKRC